MFTWCLLHAQLRARLLFGKRRAKIRHGSYSSSTLKPLCWAWGLRPRSLDLLEEMKEGEGRGVRFVCGGGKFLLICIFTCSDKKYSLIQNGIKAINHKNAGGTFFFCFSWFYSPNTKRKKMQYASQKWASHTKIIKAAVENLCLKLEKVGEIPHRNYWVIFF